MIPLQPSGEQIRDALNPVGFGVLATGMQLLGSAASVPNGAVCRVPSPTFLVGPQPRPAAARPMIVEMSMQALDTALVIQHDGQAAEHDPPARSESFRIGPTEAAKSGSGDIERLRDFAPQVELARQAPDEDDHRSHPGKMNDQLRCSNSNLTIYSGAVTTRHSCARKHVLAVPRWPEDARSIMTHNTTVPAATSPSQESSGCSSCPSCCSLRAAK
jgi:hypothetical protein